jgi:hypothetical protein
LHRFEAFLKARPKVYSDDSVDYNIVRFEKISNGTYLVGLYWVHKLNPYLIETQRVHAVKADNITWALKYAFSEELERQTRINPSIKDSVIMAPDVQATHNCDRVTDVISTLASHGINNGVCAICMDDFEIGDEISKPICVNSEGDEYSHPEAYHSNCIAVWNQQRESCPLCRRKIKNESLIPVKLGVDSNQTEKPVSTSTQTSKN